MLTKYLIEKMSWAMRKIVYFWRVCEVKCASDYFYSISLLIGVLLVVGMGPTLQIYVSSLLISDEANIYDSAYQHAIQRFPDLAEWLLYIINPQVLISSIAVCWSALTSSQVRIVLIRSFAAATISLTATDLIYLIAGNNFSIESLFICLASNVSGGFLIALIVVSMRSFAFYVADFEVKSRMARSAGFIVPALMGAVISGSTFIVAKTVYDPSPVSFSAVVSPESWGYYRPEKISSEKDKESFQLFRDVDKNGRLKWTGMSMPLVVEWESSHSAYRMSLDFYTDCMRMYEGQQPQLPIGRPALSLGKVRSVKVKLDEGMSEHELISDGSARFDFKERQLSSFSIDRKEENSIKFTIHPSEDERLSVFQDGQKKLFFSSFLVGHSKKDASDLKERTFSFLIDGKNYLVKFKPSKKIRKDAVALCSPINLEILPDGIINEEVSAVSVSMVLTLTPIEPDVEYIGGVEGREDQIRFSGSSGWLVYEPKSSSHRNDDKFSHGFTDFLVISGVFDSFQVEGAAMPTLSVNSLQAFGGVTEIDLKRSGVFNG